MIHKIKSLYDNGNGLGKKAIARKLNISKNTVCKYLAMDEVAISAYLSNTSRQKKLDDYSDYIISLLKTFPNLSAVKIQRKLQKKHPELILSSRTIRRYVKQLKETTTNMPMRHYEPILDHVPGEQCQVDPGELRGVLINGKETTVHFVVFVLSFSRLMYVALSPKAINTECFIKMHDAAFRYFDGVTTECVYDQTKLVVIKEEYRELTINARFNEYASHVGFQTHACEGYDPESKGKVEAGVKYVKGNALYGEVFESWSSLESYMSNWLDTIANQRIHATTGEIPQTLYDQQERSQMKCYLTPENILSDRQLLTRKADKTGLISFKSNKYSVPMAYQRINIAIDTIDSQLHIYDLETGEEVATHTLTTGKGKVIKNNRHYKDPALRIEKLELIMQSLIGETIAEKLCQVLKTSHPKIYKDQLAGVNEQLKAYEPIDPGLLDKLSQRPRLSATQVRDYLQAYTNNTDRLQNPIDSDKNISSSDALQCFASIQTQEVIHEHL
ncbi:MAG: IS21 family transposase [Candidatus Marinimicrobia bacterium]|nr:IS21 family transposase [Gammaproteobacteria bacterium]MBT6472622.1 IS21 family transposase [Candidatus Neomarinimicrobiota bacterium]